jgi:hypothetical protein
MYNTDYVVSPGDSRGKGKVFLLILSRTRTPSQVSQKTQQLLSPVAKTSLAWDSTEYILFECILLFLLCTP